SWWASVSRFGREVRRPLAVTHRILPSSGVPTYSGYQRTERANGASVDAAHPNGPDLSARKTASRRATIPIENPIENPIDRIIHHDRDIYIYIYTSLSHTPRRPVSSQGFSYLSSSLFLLPRGAPPCADNERARTRRPVPKTPLQRDVYLTKRPANTAYHGTTERVLSTTFTGKCVFRHFLLFRRCSCPR
ncbi:hypothetical protein WN51_02097, partial [Melipona quadrifasciata]